MILALLQARLTSTRLPGKVMMPILGEPMLARQIERVRRARSIGRLAVATSDQASDDPLEALCERLGVACYRGPLDDVLGRFVGAVSALGPADHVVRLTGDCPLVDPSVIDAVIARHLEAEADYTNNTTRLTFPKGQDVEVVRAPLLALAAAETSDLYDREHVTPFFYRRPDRFRLADLERDPPLGDLRWTVDTPEDFAFVTRVYQALYPANPAFSSEDVVALTRDDPVRGREG
ncbi:MAG: acylneuraminate cytidylyltransferase [Caulobacteraceae bacterium]|nr:acylneuraminate cytidylyltransferase [Caulobacteraceae bacterium]